MEEEARGIGKALAMVEMVVGTGESLQEVGKRAMGIGTIKEAIGPAKEEVGELLGAMTCHLVISSSP